MGKQGSITSVQAIYVPADDLTDPAPATTFQHLDATTVLSRKISEKGIYPCVDPLESTSQMMMPEAVGLRHFETCQRVIQHFQKNNALADIIAILGMDELSEEDKAIVFRSRKMEKFTSQPFAVAEQFTGLKGSFVPLSDTIQRYHGRRVRRHARARLLYDRRYRGNRGKGRKDATGAGAAGQNAGGQRFQRG